jgi:hypothetical protein
MLRGWRLLLLRFDFTLDVVRREVARALTALLLRRYAARCRCRGHRPRHFAALGARCVVFHA